MSGANGKLHSYCRNFTEALKLQMPKFPALNIFLGIFRRFIMLMSNQTPLLDIK